MNSALEGLRPTVGLRRPNGAAFALAEANAGAPAPGRPISIGVKAFGRWSAWVPNEFGLKGLRPVGGLRRPKGRSLRRRRPTLGAERLGRPISIGVEVDPPGGSDMRFVDSFGLL